MIYKLINDNKILNFENLVDFEIEAFEEFEFNEKHFKALSD